MKHSFNTFKFLLLLIFQLTILFGESSIIKNITLPVFRINGNPYIKVADLTPLPGISSTLNEFESLELDFLGAKISLNNGGSYFRVNNELYHMPLWVELKKNDFYIPYHGFFRVLEKLGLINSSLDPAKEIVSMELIKFNITKLSFDKKTNGCSIRVHNLGTFNLNSISSTLVKKPGEWLSLTIPRGRINSEVIDNSKIMGPIKRIRTTQLDESAQLSFQLNQTVDDVDIRIDETTNDLLIIIRVDHSENAERIKEIRNKYLLDTIVIDPGHGGKDPGTLGQKGTKEKDIVLDISMRLGKLIENEMGVKVIYTRTTDVFIPLWKRTKIANESGGKVFISIHANSTSNHSVRGFETYLLRTGKSDDAIDVAQRENSVIKLEEKNHPYQDFSSENLIIATMLQNVYIKESEFFASVIQEELENAIGTNNRGVKQAGFQVLVGASMPNVLIETGFLSNSKEEKNFNKKGYRKKIAQGIFNALVEFKDKYENAIINE
jgi:N-acetylmuramoyl-L-alanine amidase